MKATIHERGNGFPDPGDYIPGNDGELYRLVRYTGRIETGPSGAANRCRAEVELASWDDCSETDEYPASVVPET